MIKDPNAVLDYKFDWAPLENGLTDGDSNWLDRASSPVESIASISAITVTGGTESPISLTVDSSSLTDNNTSVTVYLSGGVAGQNYRVACRIVTSAGTPRTDERSIVIRVRER